MARYLVVKNWDQFQHYKDRDPPWIKFYRDTFSTEAWVLGTDLSRLVQVASMLLAARYKNETPFNFELLRRVASLNCSEKQFHEAITHLCACNFLEVKEDSTVASIALASCATTSDLPYSEQSRAEQRESRGEQTTTARIRAPDEPEEFAILMSIYPRRAGANPRNRALKACNARLSEGFSWEEMTEGVRRYAEFIRRTGKEGTEYVRQSATFLGPDKSFQARWDPPRGKAEIQQDANIAAGLSWLESTREA